MLAAHNCIVTAPLSPAQYCPAGTGTPGTPGTTNYIHNIVFCVLISQISGSNTETLGTTVFSSQSRMLKGWHER